MRFNEAGQELLPIGVIAKSYGVSENKIRRMEAAGLLTPAFVSKESGYRYYDDDNVSRIGTILTLKSFGFYYDDIRDYFKNSGDYSELFRRLLQKAQAMADLIDRMNRLVKVKDRYHCGILACNKAYCFTKKFRMIPSLSPISDLSHELLFEAIKRKLPVDYARAPLIRTDSMDFRTYDAHKEQDILFSIPLREQAEGPDIDFLPDQKVFAYVWSYPGPTFEKMASLIDNVFTMHDLRQNDTLRATYDVGGYTGKEVTVSDTVMHILIPIE